MGKIKRTFANVFLWSFPSQISITKV